MINEKTILSSFDDKETLLKWLKKTEKALAESVLQSITPVETSDGYFNLKFNFKDGTSIETPTAIQLKGYKGDKGDTGPQGPKGDPLDVGVIPSGTNILEFDFTPYKNGSVFIGNNLQGMPEEINPEHSQVVVQLIRNNSTLYCLKVFNTGLYQGNQGEYTIYHYASNYDGWHKVAITKDIFPIANKIEELPILIQQGEIIKGYFKVLVKNNQFIIILEGEAKTDASGNLSFVLDNIPLNYASKIIRHDETNLSQYSKDRDVIALTKLFYYKYGYTEENSILKVQSSNPQKLALYCLEGKEASTNYQISARIELSLI